MNTDPTILALIARSGLDEGELLAFIEDELPAERSARVVRVLGEHPDLSAAVLAMRGDRGELSLELDGLVFEPDSSFVEMTVHQGVTGDLDADLAARIEAAGGGSIARVARTRVVHRRRVRVPTRAIGSLLAASVVAAFLGAIWAAWPSTPAPIQRSPAAPSSGALADADPAPAESRDATPTESAESSRLAASPSPAPIEWGATETIATPAEALAAAEQGRLVIRVYSPDASAGRSMVESITTTASVSRVAVLSGRLDDRAAELIAGAIPVPIGPVFAGDPSVAGVPAERAADEDRASWVYMLEVEPSERGMSLLLAGLSREPGMLVELLRSDRPVTTPASASDLSWFRTPSRDWPRRIAAPVVVQSSGR